MKTRLILIVLALAALAAAGCGSGGQSDGDLPDGDGVGDGDTQADGDTAVDGDDTSDGDAPADGDTGFTWIDGDTVEEEEEEPPRDVCTSNAQCPSDQFCDVLVLETYGQCKFRKGLCEPCLTNIECGFQFDMCISDPASGVSMCSQSCSSQPCPAGFDCLDIPQVGKQCVFDKASATENDCCVDEHCTGGKVCNVFTHRCMTACQDDFSCPQGRVCSDGHCVEGCSNNSACPVGQVCVDHKCVTGRCTDSRDCPPNNICDTVTRECKEGCIDFTDCQGGYECIEGKCHERVGCDYTGHCSLGEWCDTEAAEGEGECLVPEGPWCQVCAEQRDCEPYGYCAEFQDDNGNSLGKFCIVKWNCDRQSPDYRQCPRGYNCGQVEEQGGAKNYVCARNCTVEWTK